MKTKDVEARLGDPAELPSVAETKAHIAELLEGTLGRHLAEAEAEHQVRLQPLVERRVALRHEQRQQRAFLKAAQTARQAEEARHRAQRFRSGIKGIWDRLIGRHARTRRENEAEASAALQRDRAEHLSLVQMQLRERRGLQREFTLIEHEHKAEIAIIYRDMNEFGQPHQALEMSKDTEPADRHEFGPRPRHGPSL